MTVVMRQPSFIDVLQHEFRICRKILPYRDRGLRPVGRHPGHHFSCIGQRRFSQIQQLRSSPWHKPQSFISSHPSNHATKANHPIDSQVAVQQEDTIYALSTSPGRAAIAIIRVSGPASLTVYHALCPDNDPPLPRKALVRSLHGKSTTRQAGDNDAQQQILDAQALVLYFPAPRSATGEDIVEFHVHGGPAVVKAVLSAIGKASAPNTVVRYAEPGEFTKRAFFNDCLNLTQVEALGDTLAAETEQQRRLAIRGSSNVLADKYESWRRALLEARGELEALIDFAEDQQFDESPATLCASVARQAEILRTQIRLMIENASRGELLRDGINIALIGPPNAGKSSLLNQIVGRDAAIVSAQAGTTRDVVDVSIDIDGYLCRFGDLAGVRNVSEEEGPIEAEGIKRAKHRALQADVVVVFLSVREGKVGALGLDDVFLDPEVEDALEILDPDQQKVVFVLNKADLFPDSSSPLEICRKMAHHHALSRFPGSFTVPVSCLPGKLDHSPDHSSSHTVDVLLQHLVHLFHDMTSALTMDGIEVDESMSRHSHSSAWSESLGASQRQKTLLEQCHKHLTTFLDQVRPMQDVEKPKTLEADEIASSEDTVDVVLGAESLRAAADCLAKITGKGAGGDVEDVLGVVFEKFCVGK